VVCATAVIICEFISATCICIVFVCKYMMLDSCKLSEPQFVHALIDTPRSGLVSNAMRNDERKLNLVGNVTAL
jgi:hypothetical protein